MHGYVLENNNVKNLFQLFFALFLPSKIASPLLSVKQFGR